MNDKGFIKLYRSLLDWEWYDDINTFRLFIHCLLRANWEDTKWRNIEVKKGSFITSLNTLSEETGLSIQNIRTSLSKLLITNELTSKSYNKYRIVTLNNYDTYQQANKQVNKRTNKQLTIDKELKNIKKEYYNEILTYFNTNSGLKNIRLITDKRKSGIDACINNYSLKDIYTMIDNCNNSNFLQGINNKNWSADFDWCFKPNNFIKILEGNYNNKKEISQELTMQELFEKQQREENNKC